MIDLSRAPLLVCLPFIALAVVWGAVDDWKRSEVRCCDQPVSPDERT